MKWIILIITFFLLSCVEHPAEDRFYDHPGKISYKDVTIRINYGTSAVKDNIIVSRVQTPHVNISIKSENTQEIELSFLLANMPQNTLPALSPERGAVSLGETSDQIRYTVTVQPTEEINVRLNSYQQAEKYRFGVVGDIQSNWKVGEKILQDALKQDLDFFIIVGDLISFPENEEYKSGLKFLNQFPLPTYVVMGNHEGDLSWGDGYRFFRDYFGKANYDFIHNKDLFLILDSSEQSISENIYNYAETTLNKEYRHKFVFLHVPPFDEYGARNNSFSSSFLAARFVNLLQKNSVDISFSGHIHSYQDFTVSGVRLITVGTGGGIAEEFDGVGYGYLVVDVDGDDVKVEKIDI